MVWTVQNLIDPKDQMKFKVLLANWWSLAPRWGAIEVPRKGRRKRNMAKFVYMSFIMWGEGMNRELYMDKIKPKLENEEIELLHDGAVYGVLEDSVMIHRTDLDIGAFTNYRAEACTIDGKNWIDHARTITTTPF